eukprot:7166700-Pyramimonas_sp.AAC.1
MLSVWPSDKRQQLSSKAVILSDLHVPRCHVSFQGAYRKFQHGTQHSARHFSGSTMPYARFTLGSQHKGRMQKRACHPGSQCTRPRWTYGSLLGFPNVYEEG